MTESPESGESGVILITVLSVLALSSAVMVAILTLQDISIERSTRFMDASSASAYALGGEASAIAALRRDVSDAPETDHYGEAWAAIQDENVPIDNGRFSLVIEDDQARFNLNNLLSDGLGAEEVLRALLQSLRAPPGLASAIASFVKKSGGLSDLNELSAAGVDPALMTRLAQIVCALPTPTDINVNTAPEPLLAAVLGNGASARLLISRRDKQGYLTPADLASARVLLPARAGFRSDYYSVSTTVTYGTVTQTLVSRLHRTKQDNHAGVNAWSRKRNAAARLPEPPFQN